MYIHEAVQKAQEVPSIIARPDFGRAFLIVPQNPRDCIYAGTVGSLKTVPGWEPSAEDLLADDWKVTRAEGIEWPAPAPTPIQRVWARFLRGYSD